MKGVSQIKDRMNAKLTSKERLINTLNRRPVDHVPLLLRFWPLSGDVDEIPFDWRDQVRRVENTLALGLDDTLLLQPPLGYVEEYIPERVPGVVSRTGLIPAEDDRYPLLKKVYETPTGPLQTVVRITEDWPHGEEIRLFDDHNISRLKEPLIKNREDLPGLEHLLGNPGEGQLQTFREQAARLREQAQRLGVALEGGWSALGDAAVWVCGMERILYGQTDEPEFLEQLLDVILEWELQRMDQVLSEGVDVWVHMAWYEGSDFWSPRYYRRLLKPRLAKMVARAHAHGVPFRYIITKGWTPIREDILELGIDCLTGLDPVQDRVNLQEVKQLLGGRLCLMGGVNSGVMLTQWGEEQIRQAVTQALEILAPGGGFILYPVDAVFNTQPWDKVQALIDQWKTCQNLKEVDGKDNYPVGFDQNSYGISNLNKFEKEE